LQTTLPNRKYGRKGGYTEKGIHTRAFPLFRGNPSKGQLILAPQEERGNGGRRSGSRIHIGKKKKRERRGGRLLFGAKKEGTTQDCLVGEKRKRKSPASKKKTEARQGKKGEKKKVQPY